MLYLLETVGIILPDDLYQIVSEDFKRKNIFKRADLTKDAEIRTIKKFMVPLDIITMTPEEYENKTTLMAEYAHEGEVVFAS